MKFFGIFLAFGLLINDTTQIASPECREGKVRDAGKGVCMQPDYIEGCESYTDVSSCGTCKT